MIISMTLIECEMTYGSSEDDRTGVEVDLDDVALWYHLYSRHLPFGQHFIHKIIPGYVPPAGIDGVEQAHDDRDDKKCAQSLPIHLILLFASLFLF